jgi:salicylate hydroxylase
MGPNGHALTFPVSHGTMLNLVAFKTDDKDWPDDKRLTLPATREEIVRDFRGFGPNVDRLIGMINEKPDRVRAPYHYTAPGRQAAGGLLTNRNI